MSTIRLAAIVTVCWAPGSSAYPALAREAKNHLKEVDVPGFRALRQAHPELVLIDVRKTEEWVKGHPAGSIHSSKG